MLKIFGIIGYPVKHSLSPVMHNAAFKALDLEAEYRLFEVKPDNLAKFMQRVRQEKIAGLSVTIPHKVAVMKLLDVIDEKAKAIGAVNTVINKNGRLLGTNTDGDGAIEALVGRVHPSSLPSTRGLRRTGEPWLQNKKVVVFGAGGSARAIVYGLHEQGARAVILNRHVKKAQELARKYRFMADKVENCYQYPADVIINTTPVGMEPNSDQSIVPTDYLQPDMIVFDIVYQPKMTKLLKEAKTKGCTIVTGDKMLLYQGVKQFELFIGQKAPLEIMRKTLDKRLSV